MALFGRSKPSPRLVTPADLGVDPFNLPALVAAAVELQSTEEETQFRAMLPAWQKQAMEMYDLLGECWYPAQFYARQLARVRLYSGIREDNGEIREDNNDDARGILARITGPWQEDYGRLQFLIGDGNLVGSLDDDGEEQWEYLSPAEFKRNGKDKFERYVAPGGKPRDLKLVPSDAEKIGNGQAIAYRLWTRHPMHSALADAPIRAVLPLYQYLMLVDKAAAAQALSRIVGSGLLVVAEEVTLPGADGDADPAGADGDPFMSKLARHVMAPITNPGSVAQVAPLLARIQIGEKAIDDVIKLIQLHDPNQTADWQQRIEKAITRIAIGLDMPPEEFLGLAEANHWSGWIISQSKWQAHGEPKTIQLCEDLTRVYFRKACRAADIPDWEKRVVWYDDARVVTHPDRGKDANEVHDRGELSGKALREAHDFSPSDAPSAAERRFFEAVKLKIPARPKDAPEEPVSDTGSDAPEDEPEDRGQRTQNPSPMNDGQMVALQAAGQMALEECRRRAGNKVWQKRMQCEQCFKGMDDVPKYDLAALVGIDTVRALDYSSDAGLVSGGADTFVPTAMRYGLDEKSARLIAGQIERFAADTLYETSPILPALALRGNDAV